MESFNSRVRDELLSVEVFTCLAEAKVMVEDFRQDYNRCRPHRAHGMLTPSAFAARYRAEVQAHSIPLLSPLGGSEQGHAGTTTNHQLLSQRVDP